MLTYAEVLLAAAHVLLTAVVRVHPPGAKLVPAIVLSSPRLPACAQLSHALLASVEILSASVSVEPPRGETLVDVRQRRRLGAVGYLVLKLEGLITLDYINDDQLAGVWIHDEVD